jgi:hypothetical protein
MILNVPEWPSNSFDLNQLNNLMARPENGCLVMINQLKRDGRILK